MVSQNATSSRSHLHFYSTTFEISMKICSFAKERKFLSMARHLFLNLLICGCLLSACGSGSTNNTSTSSNMSYVDDGVTVIPMNARPGDVLNLSDFAESIELIPLETNDDCLIGWMPEIIATEKYYYMISAVGYDFQKLYVFDKQGKFVRQISSRGQGGGEFIEVRDFDVIGDSIIKMGDVLAIRTFNLEGRQLSSRMIDEKGVSTREIISMKGKTILFNMGKSYSRSAENLLYQLDEKDCLQTGFFEVPSLANRISSFFCDAAALTKDDEYVYFHFPYDNYIYRIDAETLDYRPLYKVDYGSKNFTWDMFDEDGDKSVWSKQCEEATRMSMNEILSLNDYFLFTSVDNEYRGYISLYSTKTGKVLNGNRIKDDMYFKGNVIELNPKPGMTLDRHCNDEGDLIWAIQPSVLLKGIKAYYDVLTPERWNLFCKKYPRLVEVCEQLEDDDNPVLLKIKLKDF